MEPTTGKRSASVLTEFALVALTLTMILAAILDFGRAMFDAQGLQQAADVMARELSRTPLPALTVSGSQHTLFQDTVYFTLPDATQTTTVRTTIFDGQYLDVDPSQLAAGQTFTDFFADKPVVNRLLAPLMLVDSTDGHYRYPGVVKDGDGIWKIPVMTTGNPQLVPVVEEILTNPADPNSGLFALDSTAVDASGNPSGLRGTVALRINYGFQGQALKGYRYQTADGTFLDHIPVGETGFTNVPTGQLFYRLLSAQAVYRRELFTN